MQIWYDRHGQPLDTATAERLLGDQAYKRVALTEITSTSDPATKYRISTVWLGIDHSFGDGSPIIFETMVFTDGSMRDEYMDRYATEEQARIGHAEIVTMVAATVPDEQVTELDNWPAESETEPADTGSVGLHLHKWGEWQNGTATYDSPLLPKLGTWKGPVQTRRCAKCGKTELRKVT